MTTPYDDDDVSADLGSQFLKQDDVDSDGTLFSITRVEKMTFEAQGGRPPEKPKWVLTFEGGRCFGLNKTNLGLMAKWFGKKASAWVGKAIIVYRDESVQYAGRLTGGLRLRRPTRHDNKPLGQAVSAGSDPAADDIGF